MNRRALIFASESGFGELISQVIDDFGGFHAKGVSLDSLTGAALQLRSADLGIIDADIGLKDMSILIRKLRESSPTLSLILIPSKKNLSIIFIQGQVCFLSAQPDVIWGANSVKIGISANQENLTV